LKYQKNTPENQEKKDAIADLFKNLIWMMFRLGGVGQGARRPRYERDRTPLYRGSTLFSETRDEFWLLPCQPQKFCERFQQRLGDFYSALATLTGKSQLTLLNTSAGRTLCSKRTIFYVKLFSLVNNQKLWYSS
jgi:CRISPR-associated protein Cmr6